jgi:uncharacterized integral membrane protein
MNLKASDVISILTGTAGVCGILSALILTTVVSVQAQLHPGAPSVVPAWAIISSAVVGAVGTLSANLVRIFNVKAGAPATAIVADAPIVAPSGTPTGAQNVTTTTLAPIMAPQALTENPTLAKGP